MDCGCTYCKDITDNPDKNGCCKSGCLPKNELLYTSSTSNFKNIGGYDPIVSNMRDVYQPPPLGNMKSNILFNSSSRLEDAKKMIPRTQRDSNKT